MISSKSSVRPHAMRICFPATATMKNGIATETKLRPPFARPPNDLARRRVARHDRTSRNGPVSSPRLERGVREEHFRAAGGQPMSALEIALEYIDRRWSPIPVPRKSKRPTGNEEQKLRVTQANARQWVND